MTTYEIHSDGDWSALYVDGALDHDSVGDSYIAVDRVLTLLGVKQVQDAAFMQGQSQRSGVAETLEQVAFFRDRREQRKVDAVRMREEGERLLAEARAIEQAKW